LIKLNGGVAESKARAERRKINNNERELCLFDFIMERIRPRMTMEASK
jgi:hypothetical protein